MYGFEGVRLYDGDIIRVGEVSLRALHTPGHTPEHLSFLVTDGGLTDQPGYLLSGDFVFVGDLGRPDLLDEVAGGKDTRYEGARQLFASLRDRFLSLPDYLQVWPGHGAGSACGKVLGDVASTTVGYERTTAWWRRYVDRDDVEGFTTELLKGQVDAPRYFGRMKRQNRDGPALLAGRPKLRRVGVEELRGSMPTEYVLIDPRPTAELDSGVVPGALIVPGGSSFSTYAAYVFDPEQDDRSIVLLASTVERAEELRERLSYVGIDQVVGYIDSLAGIELVPRTQVTPAQLAMLPAAYLLDVRSANEFDEGHIDGARLLHVGRLIAELDRLPREDTLVVYCETGGRAAVAAGLLRSRGFHKVVELQGSYVGWLESQRVPAS